MASSPPTLSLLGRFFRYRRRQHGRPNLPLPVHAEAAHSAGIASVMSESFDLLEDAIQYSFAHLHRVQNSMLYWQSREEQTESQTIYSMVFERGPRAFFVALQQSWTILKSNGSLSEYFMKSQSDMVLSKLSALNNMKNCLASFVSQIYSEVDERREGLTENPSNSLQTVFLLLNTVFAKLEVSLTNSCQGQTLPSTNKICFKRLPEVDIDSALTADAISLVYQNLQELDSFVSYQLSSFERPSRTTIYWLPYTFGTIGLCACSLWLLHHNRLMDSCDMDSWIFRTKNSFSSFWDCRVKKPIISNRGEFMETYKRADKHVMEPEEAQFYKASLHRYEEELKHPVQNMFSEELARTMLIEIQNHRLDLQQSLVELGHIVKANRINFVMLAALPTFGLSLLLLLPVRALPMHDQCAEGKGKIARRRRRLLLIQAEQKLMEFMRCKDNGMDEEACCKFGLAVYALDRL